MRSSGVGRYLSDSMLLENSAAKNGRKFSFFWRRLSSVPAIRFAEGFIHLRRVPLNVMVVIAIRVHADGEQHHEIYVHAR